MGGPWFVISDLSISHFYNAFAAAKSLPEQTPEEPAAADEPAATVAAEKLPALEEPALPKELAALEEPAAGRQQARIKILPPKPPHQPVEDMDVEMAVVEPAMVSIYSFLFHLLTVLEDPPPEAKGSRRRCQRPPQILQAPLPSGCRHFCPSRILHVPRSGLTTAGPSCERLGSRLDPAPFHQV